MGSPALLMLTAAALSGIAARSRGGHGVPVVSTDAIGAEAVELARAALAAIGPDAGATPGAAGLTADDVRTIIAETFERSATETAPPPKAKR
jgi:hypothetical protein